MKDIKFDSAGNLKIPPSATSSHHDFDFYVGKWKIRNRKLKKRLEQCDDWIEFEADQEMELIINGYGNTDNFITSFDGEPFEGRSLRLFDPKTKLWSMYWTDNISCKLQSPTVGSFDGNVGKFYDKDVHNGKEIIVLFEWDKSDIDNPVWKQAFSEDNGKTWEYNWYMYSSRIE